MVSFINYTGDFPNLCYGVLTLEIDDKIYKFGDDIDCLPSFWTSGGRCVYDDNESFAYLGRWIISYETLEICLPEYMKYNGTFDEIEFIFNENVPFGCCGGCI